MPPPDPADCTWLEETAKTGWRTCTTGQFEARLPAVPTGKRKDVGTFFGTMPITIWSARDRGGINFVIAVQEGVTFDDAMTEDSALELSKVGWAYAAHITDERPVTSPSGKGLELVGTVKRSPTVTRFFTDLPRNRIYTMSIVGETLPESASQLAFFDSLVPREPVTAAK